jgi:hypothetical protein
VQPVEETVTEKWFLEATKDKEVDVIIVIGHIGVRMAEFGVIPKAIRSEHWDTPLLYFGGHVHVRDYTSYDSKSAALASGRYLETIGFLSVDGISRPKSTTTLETSNRKKDSLKFSRRYIDNNLFSLQHHSQTNDTTFHTPAGRKVSTRITAARKKLDLSTRFGCAPETLYVNRAPYPSNASIFSWLADTVFPSELAKSARVKDGKKALAISNTGAIRFDVFKGPFTVDTAYLMSPFTSGFRYVADVPAEIAVKVLEMLNGRGPILAAGAEKGMEEWRLAPVEQAAIKAGRLGKPNTLLSMSPQVRGGQQQQILNVGPDKDKDLRPGYTTTDDLGTDGDDTEHAPIDFYVVPNCVQASVGFDLTTEHSWADDGDDSVDLVYNEFVQPWIVLALQYLGLNVTEAQTQVYYEGKLITDVITDWVGENWKCT